ncbi:MAG: hypothetical protein IJ725_05665 [Ruminococcus sp.]|nr:hypothetical protein [Ruminococcus sp.]
MKKTIIGIFLVVCIIISASGCGLFKSDEQKMQDRILALADAYNAGDVDALIDCFDSKTKSVINGALGIGNAIIGDLFDIDIKVEDVLRLGTGLAGLEYGDSLKINSINITKILGSNASAKVELSFTNVYSEDKETTSGTISVGLSKENDDWFISKLEE